MHPARELWTLFEPIHAVTYFAPEAIASYEAAGLRGYWRGYFAGRSAPLGAVGPEPVIAAFYGFAPSMVSRALPSVWSLATPEETLAARRSGAVAALTRLVDGADVSEAAGLLERAVDALDLGGHVLGAAHAALPRPEEPVARLWQAAGTLREHRGDAHVAALVTYGVGPCESLALRESLGMPRAALQPFRGWTDEEWDAATEALRERGALGDQGLLDAVEAATDNDAVKAWRDVDVDRAPELLTPIAAACMTLVPAVSPIGLPAR